MGKEKKPEVVYDTIMIEDCVYSTTLNESFRRRKPWIQVNDNNILSPLPGTVNAIHVVVGQKVAKGESIMGFTAMKMNNNIRAPKDAVIKAINVAINESIAKGTVMIEME